MSYALTPRLGLYKPTVDADDNLWGDHLNANADVLDVTVGSVVNVLAYGAKSGTGFDSAPAFNAACAAGRDVFVPSGTYRLNSQINVQQNTIFHGASDHTSILFIDDKFSPSASGVLSLNGFEAGGPVVRHLLFQFTQPPDVVTTASATSAAGTTTVTVNSITGVAVGNYISNRTQALALPFPITVTAIAGNVVTLSAPVVAPGVAIGNEIRFGPSRANMKTLGEGGTSFAGGTGVKYPPAIYLPSSQTNRVRLSHIQVFGAWDGFVGCPFWIDNIEMGALNIGWNTDGTDVLDCVHVTGWHSWLFGFTNNTLGAFNTHHDGQVIAWKLGRIDGLNAAGLSFVDAKIVLTANATTFPWLWHGLMMDGNHANVEMANGNLHISGFYTSGSSEPALRRIMVAGGYLTMTNYHLSVGGSVPCVGVSGGRAIFSNGFIATANPSVTVFEQTGGTMMVLDNYFELPGTITTPIIDQTNGAIVVHGNVLHEGVSGPFLRIGLDSSSHSVINNVLEQYSLVLPAEPLLGLYSTGWDGVYGKQIVLGKATQAGRVDFRRGTDGGSTAWVGFANASGSVNTFDVTNSGGSSQVRLNAGSNGADVFMVAGVEVGRVDLLGHVIARASGTVTAPGAGFARLAFVNGTTAGTARLVAYAGTSTTPTTIVDNIGAGF